MIQLYLDGELIYDSRVKASALLGLTAQIGLNKAGAATITLPPGHPYYGSFESYRSVVEIWRDDVLRFRGRVLFPTDDFTLVRTITCEGERCFLRDGIHRPYNYNDTPANIFTTAIGLYNAQVDAFKHFVVGTIDDSFKGAAIVLENEEAETFAATVDKLVEVCGGVIVFTTNSLGQRVINWYSDIGYSNNQVIEFGSNLMDFSRTETNSDLATRIIPYGAKIGSSADRVTIVNARESGGLDFIEDKDEINKRGVICKAVYWDEITEPDELLKKAQQYLETSKKLVNSLTLTAIDLSLIDKNTNTFRVGDVIAVRSKPHGLNETFQLTEQTIDFLNPQNDRIVLGKTVSLTSANATESKKTDDTIKRLNRAIRSDYNTNTDAIIEEVKVGVASLIQQTSESLMLDVSAQYATQDGLREAISTTLTQLQDSFEFLFTELRTTVDANDAEAREQISELRSYIRFEDGNIILGKAGNFITLKLLNDKIQFLDSGAEVAYFSDNHLTVQDATFVKTMRVGNFAFIPRTNKNLSLVKVGGS